MDQFNGGGSEELRRDEAIGWYRNPARTSQDSLGVAYEDGGETKIMRPDFVFFARLPDGTVAADIVDPHGTHFSDALPKLKGLAQYAEAQGSVFRRIEAVAKVDDGYRVLDLTELAVRNSIKEAGSAIELFRSDLASDYS